MAKKKDMLEAFRSAGALRPLPPKAPEPSTPPAAPADAGRERSAAAPDPARDATPPAKERPRDPRPGATGKAAGEPRSPAPTDRPAPPAAEDGTGGPFAEETAARAKGEPAPTPAATPAPPAPHGDETPDVRWRRAVAEATAAEGGRPAPRWTQSLPLSPPILVLLVLIALAFGGGAWLARQPVAAAGGAGDEGEHTPSTLAGGTEAAGPEWLRDLPAEPRPEVSGTKSGLQDPENRYTLVVITYGPSNENLAWATYDHLEEAGVDVHAPHRVGDKIVLFAGASPTLEGLADLERKVRNLSRDGVEAVYDDAYAVRIDDYIKR